MDAMRAGEAVHLNITLLAGIAWPDFAWRLERRDIERSSRKRRQGADDGSRRTIRITKITTSPTWILSMTHDYAAALPEELVRAVSLIGPEGYV